MGNGLQMTLEEFMQETFQEQIVGVSDFPVRTSVLPESSIGSVVSLSDILEDQVEERFFLSDKTVERLLNYKDSKIES